MKRFLFKHTPIPNCLVHYLGQTVNFQIHPMMDNTTFVHIQTNSTYKFVKGQILNFRMCNQLVAYRTLLHIIFTQQIMDIISRQSSHRLVHHSLVIITSSSHDAPLTLWTTTSRCGVSIPLWSWKCFLSEKKAIRL